MDANSPEAKCIAAGLVWVGGDDPCRPARGDTGGFDLGAAAAPRTPGNNPARTAAPRQNAPAPVRPTSVVLQKQLAANLRLTFEVDSATLTPQAIANAQVFAKALATPELQQARFEIEGHTDMTGGYEHNRDLSQRRAEAVKAFLVSQGVSADRLAAHGYSFDRLEDPSRPDSPENRRVVARRIQ